MNVTDISNSSGIYLDPNQINGVSGASAYVPMAASTASPSIDQMRKDIKQNSQDFKALKNALKSNDLAGATQAFATLQQDIQKASQAAGGQSPFDPSSPIGKDFQALGDALQSGDLSAAKKAFATFRQDIKSAGHAARAHHHHRADNDGDADDGVQGSATTATDTETASSGTSSGLNAVA
jgi:TolA-binding protein